MKTTFHKFKALNESQGQDKNKKPILETVIRFACTANQVDGQLVETDHICSFTSRLLKIISRENVHITDIFRQIEADIAEESNGKQNVSCTEQLPEDWRIFLNEKLSGEYKKK